MVRWEMDRSSVAGRGEHGASSHDVRYKTNYPKEFQCPVVADHTPKCGKCTTFTSSSRHRLSTFVGNESRDVDDVNDIGLKETTRDDANSSLNILTRKLNDTIQAIRNLDTDVDMFLLFEELETKEGNPPPTARKDLSEFLNMKRRMYVKCFHVIAVNQTAQLYLARDLHNTVHGGLLRPGIFPFLRAITQEGVSHKYYGAFVGEHHNEFLRILNGDALMSYKAIRQLDFDVAMRRVNPSVVGQRWNSQYTWGVSSLNIKPTDDKSDIVNRPTIKSANVCDDILPQFIVLSTLLLEIDTRNEFYCGMLAGKERRIHHARRLMEQDPLIPKEDRHKNVIESVSAICNLYSKYKTGEMFTGAHVAKFGADHSSGGAKTAKQLGEEGCTTTKECMKQKFMAWGIDLKWVSLFPHVDDFNAREPGHNFLGSVSRTVVDNNNTGGFPGECQTMRRMTMTFCQRKVHEDTEQREMCAFKINEVMRGWINDLSQRKQNHGDIKAFVKRIRNSESSKADDLFYKATHPNKCMYYSIFCYGQRKVSDRFQLGLYRQVEALATLVHCNGPDMHHLFFKHLLTLDKLPTDVVGAEFITYCMSKGVGNSVMSKGAAIRHQPHWTKPYLKAEMLYGLRVLLSVIDDVNSGHFDKEDVFNRLKKIKWVGDLIANHIFAVGVLRGIIVSHELLTVPVVGSNLCSAVRKKVFDDNKEMSNERIRKATVRISETLGHNLLWGEHGLCEAVRAVKDNVPGNDGYHRRQDFVWISTDYDCEKSVINEKRKGKKTQYRTEADDLSAIQNLPREDSSEVKHRWWIPEANKSACLAHFVKECLSNGSNPMEVLYPSGVGREKSSEDEERRLWNDYVTTAGNQFDMNSLPPELRVNNGNTNTVRLIKKKLEGLSGKSTKIGVIKKSRSLFTKKERNLIEEKIVRNVAKTKESHYLQREGMKPKVMLGITRENAVVTRTQLDGHVVTINLQKDAEKAWRDMYGQPLPVINMFGDNYKNIGCVWTCNLTMSNGTGPLYTTTQYPPSVLDESAVALPNGDGFAFTKSKQARSALLWWIICTLPSKEYIRSWANQLLGEDRKMVHVLAYNKAWCILSKDNFGSIFVEYNERRSALA